MVCVVVCQKTEICFIYLRTQTDLVINGDQHFKKYQRVKLKCMQIVSQNCYSTEHFDKTSAR